MPSTCIGEASKTCFHGCCPLPFPGLPEPHNSSPKAISTVASSRLDFAAATASSLHPHTQFCNHESLPSLEESFSNFNKAYPHYLHTNQADQIRAQEYHHLCSGHVCLDYVGHGLFSYSQQQSHCLTPSEAPFFDVLYKSVNLSSQLRYGQESDFESETRKRIMSFMNISQEDYYMVFIANQSSAFKLLAESCQFSNIVTVYDYENEAVEAVIKSSEKRGCQVSSAEFLWPDLRIHSERLRKLLVIQHKKRKRGLFVFPLQSRITGTRYSYLWISLAQENGWHVLLDACALGAKDMETLGLFLYQPDFLVCSFYKVFGNNPSGFCCLFVKKSSASLFNSSTTAPNIGIVSLSPSKLPSHSPEKPTSAEPEQDVAGPSSFSSTTIPGQESRGKISELNIAKRNVAKGKALLSSEIVELSKPLVSNPSARTAASDTKFRGLDHADSIGLVLISSRARYLVNWLVNALLSLRHPHSEKTTHLVRVYGPQVKFDRGPAVAFNVFDWKGEKIDPPLVQKLADRSNVSLTCGFLHHIWFSDNCEEERQRNLEIRNSKEATVGNEAGLSVVNASLRFLTNFEDVYRLWAYVSLFLDADFVEKERWRYKAINQTTIEV